MSLRRQSREWAVQIIFQLDANPPEAQATPPTPEEIFAEFWAGRLRLGAAEGDAPVVAPDERARVFAESLVRGVMRNRAAIDDRLEKRMPNWSLARIGAVERAVLRLGVYELVFADEDPAPAAVVINEAVDLAKYFGTNESGRFVNGILDAIARRHRNEKNKARESETWVPDRPPAP